ncbi:MAG: DUF2867 domain-containing protein [Pseudomonadota bacterium]
MGKVQEIPVSLPHPVLPDSDWADAWQVITPKPFSNSRAAAEAIVSSFPRWTYAALALRQLLVAPFGLKGGASQSASTDSVGIFPVTQQTRDRLVAGFDDKHLDFRIVVDLDQAGGGQAVTLTTVIRRHNRLGRTYLALIMPFHRAIIRSTLTTCQRRAVRSE